MMIKAIIFDFYGVFMPDPYEAWLKVNGIIREGIYARLSEQLDAGLSSHEVFYDGLAQASGQSASSIKAAFDKYKHIDPAMRSLLIGVKNARYTTGLISNGSSSVRVHLEAAHITAQFDTISLSAELGIIKPSPAIFTTTFEALNVTPEEVLYIDDRIENTEAAKQLGAMVITFTSPHILAEELKTRNLL